MKKIVVTLLKVVVSGAIIAWLVWNAAKTKAMWDPTTKTMVSVNVFDNLVHQPKHWGMLAWAWAFCLLATLLTFVRWWYLVRTLDIPCRFRDALRISFWGYLFNLLPLGIVGGDLVKAVMLAHEHPGMRARAVASVVVDRVVGLYLLFVVASAAILLTGFWRIDAVICQFSLFQVPITVSIYLVCLATFLVTGIGTLVIAVMFIPGLTDGRGTRALARIPRVGPTIESLIGAVRTYRQRPGMLLLTSVMSIGVHCSNAMGCYLIARGLPGAVLPLSKMLVISPLSGAMGVIPLPMGPFEFVLKELYAAAAEGVAISNEGLLVAFGYRAITIIIAAMGICFYFRNRRELAEVIHEAEEPEPAEEAPAAEVIA